MNQNDFQERKNMAYEKGLIIGEDYTNYRKLLNLYKKSFEILLNSYLNFPAIDKQIENLNLSFAPSKIQLEKVKNTDLNSKYFFCLNQFYVEKLSPEKIKILLEKEQIDEEVMQIINDTFKEIIKKDNCEMITYTYPTPERIIKNGTVVLEFVYGKNKEQKTGQDFMNLIRNQRELLDKLKMEIENVIKEKLQVEARVLIEKRG